MSVGVRLSEWGAGDLIIGTPDSTTLAIAGLESVFDLGEVAWFPTPEKKVALTGRSATGAVGTVAKTFSKALTGNAGTGTAGVMAAGNVAAALTGVAGTGAAGTVGKTFSKAATGVAGTGAAGTTAVSATVPLAGVAGTGAVGSPGKSFSKAISGVSATGATTFQRSEENVGVRIETPEGLVLSYGAYSRGISEDYIDLGTIDGYQVTWYTRPITYADGNYFAEAIGASATSAIGTLGASIPKALTGAAGSGSAGALSVTASKALSGASATAASGLVDNATTIELSGVEGVSQIKFDKGNEQVGVVIETPEGVVLSHGQSTRGIEDTYIDLGTVDGYRIAWAAPAAINYVFQVTSVAITGLGSTGAVGTATPGFSKALTGHAAVGAIGSTGVSIPLAGRSATGAVGTVGKSITKSLSGVAATGSAGSVTASGGTVTTTGRSGVVIWGDFAASRTAGKTAYAGTMKFKRAA